MAGFDLSLGICIGRTIAAQQHALAFSQADGAATGSATLRQWTPDDLTSITVASWGTASELSAGDVTSWGHVNALTEATTPPVYDATAWNNKPAVKSDGTKRLRGGSAVAIANGTDAAFTAIFAAQMTTSALGNFWSCDRAASATPFMWLTRSGGTTWGIGKKDDAGSTSTLTGLGTFDTNPHVFTIVHSGTAVSSWLDGTLKDNAAAQDFGATTLDGFTMFGVTLGGTFSRGLASNVHAFIVGTGAISAGERAIAEAWVQL